MMEIPDWIFLAFTVLGLSLIIYGIIEVVDNYNDFVIGAEYWKWDNLKDDHGFWMLVVGCVILFVTGVFWWMKQEPRNRQYNYTLAENDEKIRQTILSNPDIELTEEEVQTFQSNAGNRFNDKEMSIIFSHSLNSATTRC